MSNMSTNLYISGYDPDEWYENEIVGGEKVSAGKLGYYLGWLENVSLKELKNIIKYKSPEKEYSQWDSLENTIEGRAELVQVILCKYNPESLEQKIIEHRKQKLPSE